MSTQHRQGGDSLLDSAYKQFNATYEDYLDGEADQSEVIEKEENLQSVTKY